jgi:uncharacterized protein
MTPGVTYVSLNFDNPELKKVMPWSGTHKGPQALADVFGAIQRFWKTLDLKVTDSIEQGSRVALFGSLTYKLNVTGKEITSPFGLLARFEGDKVGYVQFLEDSYGTAGSFKTGGCPSPRFCPPVISTGYGIAIHTQSEIALAHD